MDGQVCWWIGAVGGGMDGERGKWVQERMGEWVSGWRKSCLCPCLGKCTDEYLGEWMDERI